MRGDESGHGDKCLFVISVDHTLMRIMHVHVLVSLAASAAWPDEAGWTDRQTESES